MHSKLIAACVSLVAFAAMAAVPAIAAASPELKTDGGVKVLAGELLNSVNEGNTVLTGSNGGNITCSTASLTGEVKKNSGTEIEGEITTASFTGTGLSGRCTTNISDLFGGFAQVQVTPTTPMCLSSTSNTTWKIKNGSCAAGTGRVKFILDLFTHTGTSVGSCTYERPAATPNVEGTNNFGSSPLLLEAAATTTFERTAGSTLCPATGTLDAKFRAVTDSNSTNLTID